MTNPVTVAQTTECNAKTASPEAIVAPEEQYRAGAYGMLAALLRRAPDEALLEQVAQFARIHPAGNELQMAISGLGLAASTISVASLDDEYHALFIGMARGELVPYGSWYQTGFLNERPLSLLRDDLATLGFERDQNVHEPEDHVAALCEVLAMLIMQGCLVERQAGFFQRHMETWLPRFFAELSEAGNAVFYRSVGRFGKAFMALEIRSFGMPV